MKTTGIVRCIDDLGRVVIPKEIRRTRGIAEGDPMEVFVEGDKIILQKYTPGCSLCGNTEQPLTPFINDKLICSTCTERIVQNNKKFLQQK